MGPDVQDGLGKADDIVLKRLKFVFKILKAITAQPNTRNRQAHAYILEVLDAVGDWSGNRHPELMDVLDGQILPQICSLISTFSREEFNIFQTFIAKYLLKRWAETSNFAVLDLISDIYAFITRIAPPAIVEEYVEVFSVENMPFHVTLVVLPSILRNVSQETVKTMNNRLLRSPVMCLLCVPKEGITEQQRQIVRQFWRSLADIAKPVRSFRNLTTILLQCLVTSSYLDTFPDSDLVVILQDLIDWGSTVDNFTLDVFIITSIIFLSNCWSTTGAQSPSTFHTALKNLILLVGQNAIKSENKSVGIFSMKVVQKILERSDKDWYEVIKEFQALFQVEDSKGITSETSQEEILSSLENCLKRISSDPEIHRNQNNRKRLRVLLEGLTNNFCDFDDSMSDSDDNDKSEMLY